MKYKFVSFDMFQTLVDVNKRTLNIWQGVFGKECTKEKADYFSERLFNEYDSVMSLVLNEDHFVDMKTVFKKCASNVIEKNNLDVKAENIADSLIKEHANAPFYPEVLEVLDHLKNKYSIIISSDSSRIMTDRIINKMNCVSNSFLSEEMKCYKLSTNGKFFDAILSNLNIKSDEIIHFGDGASDLISTSYCGIKCGWLHRENRKLNSELKPDYTITDLREVLEILK